MSGMVRLPGLGVTLYAEPHDGRWRRGHELLHRAIRPGSPINPRIPDTKGPMIHATLRAGFRHPGAHRRVLRFLWPRRAARLLREDPALRLPGSVHRVSVLRTPRTGRVE